MNVYVIYKFDDYEEVRKKMDEIKANVKNITFFYFEKNDSNPLWHFTARKKIKNSNMVIFFDFLEDKSVPLKNIKWELKCAEKYKKRIVVFKKNSELFSPELYEKDYSEIDINKFRYKTRNVSEAVEFFRAETGWRVENNLIHTSSSEDKFSVEDKQLLLDQYRIMIDTSEKLMERRQAVGNLYTTICTALIAFIGASFGFGSLVVSAIASLMSGIIIIVLCYNWRLSLNAYELNNAGKFEVINHIEKHLPADMFECEYRYNTLNGIRSYSAREKMLPSIFTLFGAILIALSVVLMLINRFY